VPCEPQINGVEAVDLWELYVNFRTSAAARNPTDDTQIRTGYARNTRAFVLDGRLIAVS
jgi:hypothetical protein